MIILIKGMEKPQNCYSCPIKKRNGTKIICPVLDKQFSVTDTNILFYRLKDCPVDELPPHGRLIDADALDKAIGEEVHECDWDNSSFSGYRVWGLLDDAPTVIPADPAEEGER